MVNHKHQLDGVLLFKFTSSCESSVKTTPLRPALAVLPALWR